MATLKEQLSKQKAIRDRAKSALADAKARAKQQGLNTIPAIGVAEKALRDSQAEITRLEKAISEKKTSQQVKDSVESGSYTPAGMGFTINDKLANEIKNMGIQLSPEAFQTGGVGAGIFVYQGETPTKMAIRGKQVTIKKPNVDLANNVINSFWDDKTIQNKVLNALIAAGKSNATQLDAFATWQNVVQQAASLYQAGKGPKFTPIDILNMSITKAGGVKPDVTTYLDVPKDEELKQILRSKLTPILRAEPKDTDPTFQSLYNDIKALYQKGETVTTTVDPKTGKKTQKRTGGVTDAMVQAKINKYYNANNQDYLEAKSLEAGDYFSQWMRSQQVADTAEQIAYDEELSRIEAMPAGEAKSEARVAFKEKYPTGRPGLSEEQKSSQAESRGKAFGFLKQFLDKYPDDTELKAAWAFLLDNNITDAELAFKRSKYYQNTLPESDKRMKKKLAQFGVYTKELNAFIDEQTRRLISAGVNLNTQDPKVRQMFELAFDNAETDFQIDIKALALLNGKSIGGTTGASVADLRAYSRAFGIKYTDADYTRWADDIFAGKITAYDIQNKIRQDSASAYPIYADKILGGESVDSIGSAYKSSFANILELDPDSVDWDEPILRKALQYTQDGKPAVMPVWMFEEELRRDPRWQYTNQARESVYNAVYNIGTEWGLM